MESLVDHHSVQSLLEIRVAGSPEELFRWLEGQMEIADRLKDGVRVRLPEAEAGYRADLLRRMVLEGIAVSGFFKIERRLEDAFVDVLRLKPPPLP
jgi:ABC-2 type transport system ATP-binding protein